MKVSHVHSTLWQALEFYRERYHSKELAEYLHTGGIAYGDEWSRSFKLERYLGRFTKAYLHLTITRCGNGSYRHCGYVL